MWGGEDVVDLLLANGGLGALSIQDHAGRTPLFDALLVDSWPERKIIIDLLKEDSFVSIFIYVRKAYCAYILKLTDLLFFLKLF
jgi:hypothetical protein